MIDYGLSSELLADDERHPVWAEQRKERGFDDTETWSLSSTFARFLVPRLEIFKDKHSCHPCSITMEEWDNILQEMIDGFKEVLKIDDLDVNTDKINRGLELFSKWYLDLWW